MITGYPNFFEVKSLLMTNPRQLALIALRDIYRREIYTDFALDRVLSNPEIQILKSVDRGLITELVYGVVRRQRTLDEIINQLGKKKAHQQAPDLRIILHLGLYQLRYLNNIPASAAVNTAVELAKNNGFAKLTGVVNGLLRQYVRLAANQAEPLQLPTSPVERLGILHSFPDWIIATWLDEWGETETEKLCIWFNQSPAIDLRVNPLRTSVGEVESALQNAGIKVDSVPYLPQALRLRGKIGPINKLPGFTSGWWTIQDSSAQLVSYLLDPQPGEVVVDACAAPGGKTTHIAELIQDTGKIWACDRAEKRLRKVQANAQRLQLKSIQIQTVDSRDCPQFQQIADRVLVDAPCSGLGTLHRHPDIRWRQKPAKVTELNLLQQQLLDQAATWVKPDGTLVYATCTLNKSENEQIIESFLASHPHWEIQTPSADSPLQALVITPGWIKILPSNHNMDGFFMVKLKQRCV